MSEQIHKQKQEAKPTEQVKADEVVAKDQQPLTDDVIDMLDEIDEVLEENAQTFVEQFVQKGGE